MPKREKSPALDEVPPESNPVQPTRSIPPVAQVEKRTKPRKDAPHFRKGPTVQSVNFPPHIATDPDVIQQLAEFRLFPTNGRICEYVDHVPYSSERRDFSKIGRIAFEVFQYEFVITGDPKKGEQTKPYHVMWDYNIGLVRVTSFFKACKYPKTTPARVLSVNQGLKDITYSITGGALRAQGYWMPFEVAREVASTFCWNIRYALVPIFGSNFPQTCIPPGAEGYESFVINPGTIKKCQEQANKWLEQAQRASRASPVPEHTPNSSNGLGSIIQHPPSVASSGESQAARRSSPLRDSNAPDDLGQTSEGLTIGFQDQERKQPKENSTAGKFTPINNGIRTQTRSNRYVESTNYSPYNSSISAAPPEYPDASSTPYQSPEPVSPDIGAFQHSVQSHKKSGVAIRLPAPTSYEPYVPELHVQPRSPRTPVLSSIPASLTNTPLSLSGKSHEILSPFAHVSCCGHLGCHTPCRIVDHARPMSYSPPHFHGQKASVESDTKSRTETLEAAKTLQALSAAPMDRRSGELGLILEEQTRRRLPPLTGLRSMLQHERDSLNLFAPATPRLAPIVLGQDTSPTSPLRVSSPLSAQRITLPSIEQIMSSNLTGGKRAAEESMEHGDRAKKVKMTHSASTNPKSNGQMPSDATIQTSLAAPHSDIPHLEKVVVTEEVYDHADDADDEHDAADESDHRHKKRSLKCVSEPCHPSGIWKRCRQPSVDSSSS